MINIKENNELLVDIRKFCPGIILGLDKEQRKQEKTLYLRRSVAKMINKAKGNLPEGITFIVGEAWRSQSYQKKIYLGFIKRFSKRYPKWTKDRVVKEIENYVAPYEGKNVSGHMTGGAVDIRLYQNGKKMPMKSSKLAYQENAKSNQTNLPRYIKKNRGILFEALTRAGLSNYPKEYWHWSYGDIWWAKRNKEKYAIYGPIYSIKKERQ